MKKEELQIWYDQNRAKYADLLETQKQLVKTLLDQKHIPYHSVDGRVKDRDKCIEKFQRKSYQTPEQMMDFAGLRIITHTTAEVEQVCRLIEQEFSVDSENSGNKAAAMGIDKIGYLSVHYVVRFSPERLKFSEYARFDGLCCEIQVRSLLQHAWAEISHDHTYKFAGVLPEALKRRFYLVAGVLELMDQEFRTLSGEIDQYRDHVKEQTEQGRLYDIAIDSTSLSEFLHEFFKEYDAKIPSNFYPKTSDQAIQELSRFGIQTLQQLKELLEQKEKSEWLSVSRTYIGVLRDAMILKNPKRYFQSIWKHSWTIRPIDVTNWKKLGVNMEVLKSCVTLPEAIPGDDSDFYGVLPGG